MLNGEGLDGAGEVIDLSGDAKTCSVPPAYPLHADSTVANFMNGKLTVCGGNGYPEEAGKDRYYHYDNCYQLDKGSDGGQWTEVQSMSLARAAAAGAMLQDGTWWITGGYLIDGFAYRYMA